MSLRGKTIALTRSLADSEALIDRLQALGAEVRSYPAIQRVPPSDPRPLQEGLRALEAGAYQGLVLTSPPAAEALGALHAPAVFVAAVGPGTAKVASALGLEVAVVPERHDGVALAAAIIEALGASLVGMRFLQPRAQEGREEVSRALREAGALVDVVPAYRTLPAPAAALRPLLDALGAGEVDGVVFASPSAVEAVASAAGGSDFMGSSWGVAIGETTAGALAKRGVARIVAAKAATDAGLIAATLQALTSE